MKYIIMCGGTYPKWETPRQLLEVNGEAIVARTIRLLRENGIEDIAISTNNDVFARFGVPLLRHDNDYTGYKYNECTGAWYNAFYPTDEPTTYLFGDVFYSPAAIRTIVEYQTDDIMFFASAYPFAQEYPKWFEEPFAFKVTDTDRFHISLRKVKQIEASGGFNRKPIAWEVWNVCRGGNPNIVEPGSFVVINDYTCDIDGPGEARLVVVFALKE